MKPKFKSQNEDILNLHNAKYTPKEIVTVLGLPLSRINRVIKEAYIPKYPLDEMIRAHIDYVLAVNGGNKTHAARDLGISLRCLRYRTNNGK